MAEDESICPFKDVPPEVIHLIFDRVDYDTLFRRAFLVCKRWNRVVGNDGPFWEHYCGGGLTAEEIRTVRECPRTSWKRFSSPEERAILLITELLGNTGSEPGNILYEAISSCDGDVFDASVKEWLRKENDRRMSEGREAVGIDTLLLPFSPRPAERYRTDETSWTRHAGPWRNLLRNAGRILGCDVKLKVTRDDQHDMLLRRTHEHAGVLAVLAVRRKRANTHAIVTPLVDLVRTNYGRNVTLTKEIEPHYLTNAPSKNTRGSIERSHRENLGVEKRKEHPEDDLSATLGFCKKTKIAWDPSLDPDIPHITRMNNSWVSSHLDYSVDLRKLDAWTVHHCMFDKSEFNAVILSTKDPYVAKTLIFEGGAVIFKTRDSNRMLEDSDFGGIMEEVEKEIRDTGSMVRPLATDDMRDEDDEIRSLHLPSSNE